MFNSENYYAILQVEPDADLATIKRAYRTKMRRHHPDQFVAQLAQVQQSGTRAEVHQLEGKIEKAKQMTQRINSAYAVLSDAHDRAAYDHYLSQERQRKYNLEIRQQRMRHYESERRTVKSRPHHQNPNRPQKAKEEGFPWAFLVGFIVLMLAATTLFSNAVIRMYEPFTPYVPRNPTSAGLVSMAELQATTNAQQVTVRARETMALQPTATPRSSSDNEQLGDRLMSFEQYDLAAEIYTEAIEANPHNPTVYIKRASAYAALYAQGDSDTLELALADYEQAIVLDEMLVSAYLGRGQLYYEVWRETDAYATEARSDLMMYLRLSDSEDVSEIEALLETLSE